MVTSDQVSGKLRSVDRRRRQGAVPGLRLQRRVRLRGHRSASCRWTIPDNYAFSFQLRGDSPANDLQFKLVDDSGDNVWWVNRPRYDFPTQWTPVRYKRRHISRAWGPAPDPTLRHSRKVEFTIYNSVGGKGSVCFDELTLRALPPQDDSPLHGRGERHVRKTHGLGRDAAARRTQSPPRGGQRSIPERPPQFTSTCERMREFGGVVLRWLPGQHGTDYRLELSDDGHQWRTAREVTGADGGSDYIALPESEARYLRLTPLAAPAGHGRAGGSAGAAAGLRRDAQRLRPLGRGGGAAWACPRGFSGEQPYWTILGIDSFLSLSSTHHQYLDVDEGAGLPLEPARVAHSREGAGR